MANQDALIEFEQFMRSMSRNEFAGLIYEYLIESNHQSWDGHSKRDLTSYRNLFRDIMTAHQAMVRDDPGHCNRNIYNGSEHYRPDGMIAYLQYADGREVELKVTEPDPEDGSHCLHLDEQSWVRVVPGK